MYGASRTLPGPRVRYPTLCTRKDTRGHQNTTRTPSHRVVQLATGTETTGLYRYGAMRTTSGHRVPCTRGHQDNTRTRCCPINYGDLDTERAGHYRTTEQQVSRYSYLPSSSQNIPATHTHRQLNGWPDYLQVQCWGPCLGVGVASARTALQCNEEICFVLHSNVLSQNTCSITEMRMDLL